MSPVFFVDVFLILSNSRFHSKTVGGDVLDPYDFVCNGKMSLPKINSGGLVFLFNCVPNSSHHTLT